MTTSTTLSATARSRWISLNSATRALTIAVPATLLIGALTWPLYLTSSSFAGMWGLELWFMWKQSLMIGAGHLPSVFFNYSQGVFTPQYMFSGGTPDALGGALAVALGNAPIAAYVLTYLFGFAAAYGGWYWIAHQAGLGRWQAQAPGLVFITSSSYLTLIYARGDWPEFVGVSMMPLLISAGASILRADRLRLWPALALTISCVLFVGSHVLTLVWGFTSIALVGLAIVVCVPQARCEISRRGIARLAAVGIPAALLTAWFLAPAAVYQSSTWIADQSAAGIASVLRHSMHTVSMHNLFTLSRATAAPGAPGLALSLPVAAMAWALVGLALAAFAGLRGPWARILIICAGFTALMMVTMTHAGIILALPHYWATVQYSLRLESEVLLGLSGTLLSLLVLAKTETPRLRPWVRWALPPVLAISVVGAVQQTAAYPSTGDRYAVLAGWEQAPTASEASSALLSSTEAVSSGLLSRDGVLNEYLDMHQPLLMGANAHPPLLEDSSVKPTILSGSFEHFPFVHFDTASAPGSRVSVSTPLRPGERLNTNLFGWPSLVSVTGARIIGVNSQDLADVLEVSPASSSIAGRGVSGRSGTISVASATAFPVVLGRVLTACGAIALLLQLGALAIRHRRA
jgi:hypothetical protein